MSANVLVSIGNKQHGQKIILLYSKHPKRQSPTPSLYTFLTAPYHGLFVPTHPIMLLVPSCTRSTQTYRTQLPTSHKYSGAAVNWDTFKQEAYPIYYAVTTFFTTSGAKNLLLKQTTETWSGLSPARFPSSFVGVSSFRDIISTLDT
jgi:hypothetical protein